MKVLIDTHALLWLLEDAPQLSGQAREVFLDPEGQLYFSAASYWEICIKLSIGKLELADGWEKIISRELRRNEIRWLALEPAHMQGVVDLPWHHRDPFDRLLIAQALHESMGVLTADRHFAAYGVDVIW
ncbi:MAG: type II toxin-antitoxin system VapC family toxin [Gammaproteobacteria bacterium]|nr:MAG: type II toxin-antitoxin system VapC family toxin [Gammaproteobacteria bacterium]